MDELIAAFLGQYCSDEYAEDVRQTLQLFIQFEYRGVEDTLIDVISQNDLVDSNTLVDSFRTTLTKAVDYVFEQHHITVDTATTLHQRNELMQALLQLQDLEDYTGTIRMLESLEPDEIILATVLSDNCLLDITEVLTVIESFDADILKQLKAYIYNKEAHLPAEPYDQKLVSDYRLLLTVLNKNCLGKILLDNGLRPGESFEIYLEYLDNVVNADLSQTAENILSLIYLTPEGRNNPLLIYRKYSYRLLHDLNKVSRVETIIIQLVDRINELKQVQVARSQT